MYKPYSRLPFTMGCFNLSSRKIKERMKEIENQSRREENSNLLQKELLLLKQRYETDMNNHSKHLNQTLQVVEKQQEMLNSINKKTISDTDTSSQRENFNKKFDTKHDEKQETKAEKEEEEEDKKSFLSRSSPSSSSSFSRNKLHQRNGRKISFATASLSNQQQRRDYSKKEEEEEEEESENEEEEDYDSPDGYTREESEKEEEEETNSEKEEEEEEENQHRYYKKHRHCPKKYAPQRSNASNISINKNKKRCKKISFK